MKRCDKRKYVMIKCLYYIPKLFILLSFIDMLTNYSVANKMYYGPVGLTLLNKHSYYYYSYYFMIIYIVDVNADVLLKSFNVVIKVTNKAIFTSQL